ncbi:MAG: ComEC/Rec2 family competence protein [Saprospiraceae bacterium]|nr:ComEC/Rec2 family competence protein [Saprospiraceae bacterium]
MNLHAVPCLRLLIPFAFGISLAGHFDRSLPFLPEILLAGAVLAAWLAVQKFPYRHRWVYGAYLPVLLLAFGYFQGVEHNELRRPAHFSSFLPDSHYIIGMVCDAPSKGAKMKVPLRVEALGPSPDSMQTACGTLLLFLDIHAFSDSLRYGDRLAVRTTAQPTEPPKNPHAFDYRAYLRFQNIHFQAFVKPDSIIRLSSGNGSALWRQAYSNRTRLLQLLQQHFPTTDEYAVAGALLVGYTDELSDELRAAYAETGSMHALAVSGTHIGMLYVGLMFFVGKLRLRGRQGKWLETALVLGVIWAFTFLTGATASVLRASVMFTMYMMGKASRRETSAWNVLPASAFILLLYNPYLLFNIGFQLSYAAVAGMVFFYPRFYKMFPPLPRWADEMLKVLLVGIAAQLGTLPLTLYYFQQFPVFFWLAGWVVVFVGAVFLWGGALLVLLSLVSDLLTEWLGVALYQMIRWTNQVIFLIQQIPGGVLRHIWTAGWVVFALYFCLVALGAAFLTRRGRWLAAFAGMMCLLGAYRTYSVTGKQKQQTIVVYNVNKARLVDFMDGDRVFSLSDTLSKKQEIFAAEGNRTASGMRVKTHCYLSDTLVYSDRNLLISWPFVQFFTEKMVFIDHSRWLHDAPREAVAVDVLVLSKNPKVSINECHARFPFRIVVFDASNSLRQTEYWRRDCEKRGWRFHDVRSMGAWVRRL